DHSQCTAQIRDLEAQLRNTETALQQELHNVASSAVTIKDLRNTIESLREELHKH
ncbi:hypothetical protein AAVH_41977, partial [Aphelenchoides avenae]